MARRVDEPWTKCRNPTNLEWTRAFAHDGRDPRSWPQTRPCRQSNTANQHGAWIICAKCALRLHYVPQTGCSDDIRLNTVIGVTAGGSGTRMSLLRDNDLRSRRTEASEEEGSTTNDDTVQHRVQFRTSIVDDGRGLTVVNKLLGRLARKLQRGASLVNADLSAAIQTVLGAATDQCDSVDICCCACDCHTEMLHTLLSPSQTDSDSFFSAAVVLQTGGRIC